MTNRLVTILAFCCLMSATGSARAQDTGPWVVGATAVVGGPVTFVVIRDNPTERERWLSSSRLVEAALLPALLSGSPVSVEMVAGSAVINRVLAYPKGKQTPLPYPHDYRVSRIATQRSSDGLEEHLEVFLRKGDGPEKAYNVWDPLIQTMLLAAFGASADPPEVVFVGVVIEGEDIVSVTIGEP